METNDTILCESYLKQQCITTNGLYQWKKRYFILHLSGILDIIDQIDSERTLQSISMNEMISVKTWTMNSAVIGYGFDIMWKDHRTWSFLADDIELCEYWIDTLNSLLQGTPSVPVSRKQPISQSHIEQPQDISYTAQLKSQQPLHSNHQQSRTVDSHHSDSHPYSHPFHGRPMNHSTTMRYPTTGTHSNDLHASTAFPTVPPPTNPVVGTSHPPQPPMRSTTVAGLYGDLNISAIPVANSASNSSPESNDDYPLVDRGRSRVESFTHSVPNPSLTSTVATPIAPNRAIDTAPTKAIPSHIAAKQSRPAQVDKQSKSPESSVSSSPVSAAVDTATIQLQQRVDSLEKENSRLLNDLSDLKLQSEREKLALARDSESKIAQLRLDHEKQLQDQQSTQSLFGNEGNLRQQLKQEMDGDKLRELLEIQSKYQSELQSIKENERKRYQIELETMKIHYNERQSKLSQQLLELERGHQSTIEKLQSNHQTDQQRYNQLQQEKDAIWLEYHQWKQQSQSQASLQSHQSTQWKDQHDSLQREYDMLHIKYNELLATYQSQQGKVIELTNEHYMSRAALFEMEKQMSNKSANEYGYKKKLSELEYQQHGYETQGKIYQEEITMLENHIHTLKQENHGLVSELRHYSKLIYGNDEILPSAYTSSLSPAAILSKLSSSSASMATLGEVRCYACEQKRLLALATSTPVKKAVMNISGSSGKTTAGSTVKTPQQTTRSKSLHVSNTATTPAASKSYQYVTPMKDKSPKSVTYLRSC